MNNTACTDSLLASMFAHADAELFADIYDDLGDDLDFDALDCTSSCTCKDCQDDYYAGCDEDFNRLVAEEQELMRIAAENAIVDALDALTDSLAGIRCKAA